MKLDEMRRIAEATSKDWTSNYFPFSPREVKLLLDVAEAAKKGPCRHSNDHRGLDCDICNALAKLESVP